MTSGGTKTAGKSYGFDIVVSESGIVRYGWGMQFAVSLKSDWLSVVRVERRISRSCKGKRRSSE